MTKQLRSYLAGEWVAGTGTPALLVNPSTEEVLAETSSAGLDLAGGLAWARDVGGPALRAATFAQRGEWLQALANLIYEHRDELIELGVANAGNTRGDAKFDVDGASATLAAYANLAQELGDGPWIADGDPVTLGRSSRLAGQHVWVPIEGVAVLINAYNFPAWGTMEKAACAWLAGVPVLTKPATATALLAHRMVELVLDSGILPDGALSLLCGSAGDMLEHVDERDAVAFTGSADTGASIRAQERIRARSVRTNVEADSLNAAVLGPDVEEGSETLDMFVNDVVRDMTQKTGQKCTAIRRIFVPAARLEAVTERISGHLADVRMGDPAVDGVRMGPLASASALRSVEEGLAALSAEAEVVYRGEGAFQRRDEFADKGFFHAPVLLCLPEGKDAEAVHAVEVFGPVATLIPYSDTDAMLADVRRGGGGLVASIYTDDRAFLRAAVTGTAASHGRLYLGSKKVAGSAPGPGMAMPLLKHGGPGRAGGGEELAGLRGLHFYMQRVALQGYGPLVDWLLK
jgi:oxepin-CoA hydrolase/3-oxo-5,6-dehydrosuberyl-CoA semialdehyde dehydrogenase